MLGTGPSRVLKGSNENLKGTAAQNHRHRLSTTSSEFLELSNRDIFVEGVLQITVLETEAIEDYGNVRPEEKGVTRKTPHRRGSSRKEGGYWDASVDGPQQ